MDGIIDYIRAHQFTAGLCIFAAIVIMFFLFKRLIKIFVLLILCIIVFAGYVYFKESGKMPKSISDALQKAKTETRNIVEKGRGVYETGKSVFDQRKPVTDFIDKITEQDKEAWKKKKPSPDESLPIGVVRDSYGSKPKEGKEGKETPSE